MNHSKMTFLGSVVISGILFSSSGLAKTFSFKSEKHNFKVEVLHQTDDVIWGLDFVDPNTVIFTERAGKLKTFDLKTKKVQTLTGSPEVWAKGQGGLLDVRVRKQQGKTKIYLSYAEPVKSDATTALFLGDLVGGKIENGKKIFSAQTPNSNKIHFGSRIEFDEKGFLYLSVGDRNERDLAQSLEHHTGKILRLNEDGSIPSDNPFIETKNAKKEIWSYGHRNPQGLAWNSVTGQLWEAEFGPRGGDEINLIKKSANYGWPVVTYGREYYGPKISDQVTKAGIENPVVHYVPSISPSAIAFYQADQFHQWKGNLFVGNLSSSHLRRLEISENKVIAQEELLKTLYWRIRMVRQGPDGYIYLGTDDGRLARLVPN